MIDVTTVGVSTANTGDENRDRIADACRLISRKSGVYKHDKLYFPAGTYKVSPLGPAIKQDAYKQGFTDVLGVNFCGDGIKASVLSLDNSLSTGPLLDFEKNYWFDVTMSDLLLTGNSLQNPFIMRLNSNLYHYRIRFENVWFRDSDGDGLLLEPSLRVMMDNVTITGCSGTGLRIKDTQTIDADLDIEQCGAGVEIKNSSRVIIKRLYSEILDGHEITFDKAMNCVAYTDGSVLFKNRSIGNTVYPMSRIENHRFTAVFESGSNNNYVICPDVDIQGVDAPLNYCGPFGGGIACEHGDANVSGTPNILNGSNAAWGIKKPLNANADYELKFTTRGRGKCYVQIHIDVGGTLHFYHWDTRTFTTSTSDVKQLFMSTESSRQYWFPFRTTFNGDHSMKIFLLGEPGPVEIYNMTVGLV